MDGPKSPAPAAFRVRAPGRVNLIGEHIDYLGLPVLPIAIGREIRLAVRPRRDGRIRLRNADDAYPDRDLTVAPDAHPLPAGDWGNYALAAARVVARDHGVERGVDLDVTSDLPAAAGLGSSSALVVAVALALLAADGREPDRLALAADLARGERFVGLEGGGMDQAAILCAWRGHAARIGFAPLSVEHVPVPDGWVFVVADSGERAEKSAGAREAYNRRRRESERAFRRVARALGAYAGEEGDARDGAGRPAALLADPGPAALTRAAAGALAGAESRRFRHAVGEAGRVGRAAAALADGDLEQFGALLDASHRSLRDDYEVSTAGLDALVEAARRAGAAGARLTGAGFGGCVVAVCGEGRASRVLDRLREVAGPHGAFPVTAADAARVTGAGEGRVTGAGEDPVTAAGEDRTSAADRARRT